MPVDPTDKALNLCSRLMAASIQLMDAVALFAALKDEKESAGLTLTAAAIEAAIAASTLKHANGDAFNAVIGSSAALKTWLEQNFHDDNFQKVRP